MLTVRIRPLLTCFALLFLLNCDDENPPGNSLFVDNFLNEMLDIMENNSINKNTIDWTDFRSRVFAKVAGAQTLKDIYPGITEALTRLGDNHSVFYSSDGNTISAHGIRCVTQTVVKPTLPHDVGYVKVNQYGGPSNDAVALAFAKEIQDQIKSQDSEDIVGWIVDLRSNLGGNMWPMLAGIGPILGEGISGYFIDPDGAEYPWSFSDGASIGTGAVATQLPDSYELINPNPKVAVLLDNGIASSGEVIAISFVGRNLTKSFGSPTCGLSTANQYYTLSSNCGLVLTVAYLADRNKKIYGVPVVPDKSSANDTIIPDAVAWIEN